MLSSLENFVQYFGLPTAVLAGFAATWFVMNLVGELLEFKGKVVPEYMKVRKYFARKKQERETLAHIPEIMGNVEKLLNDVDKHYCKDNISMRNQWMDKVNQSMGEFEKIKDIVLDIQIESKRNKIIDFANRAIDMNRSVSREEFNQVFKIYDEYEKIIEENGRTNGEVDISYRMINDAYKERTRTHSFVEDSRGYNIK